MDDPARGALEFVLGLGAVDGLLVCVADCFDADRVASVRQRPQSAGYISRLRVSVRARRRLPGGGTGRDDSSVGDFFVSAAGKESSILRRHGASPPHGKTAPFHAHLAGISHLRSS